MGQEANPRRVEENEARAFAKHLRTSPRKLNLVAQMLRGKTAAQAIRSLDFCERRIAGDVKKVLQSAIANAENNHRLNIDRLVVSQATVGKAFVMKRFRPRAKGRAGKIMKPFSNLTIVVQERAIEAKEPMQKKTNKTEAGAA